MITIKELAKRLGVSVATISRVVNNKGNVTSSTRQKVLKGIKEYNFIVNENARALSTSKNLNVVAFVVPDVGNEFFYSIIKKLNLRLFEMGFELFIIDTNSDMEHENRAIYNIIQKKCSLALITTSLLSFDELDKNLKMLNQYHIPYILIDRMFDNVEDSQISHICINNFDGGYSLARQVLSKTKNKSKSIAFIGAKKIKSSQDRLCGVKKLAQEQDIMLEVFEGEFDVNHGYCSMVNIIENHQKFDAIIAANGMIFQGILKALKEKDVYFGDTNLSYFDRISLLENMGLIFLHAYIDFDFFVKKITDALVLKLNDKNTVIHEKVDFLLD